MGMAYHATFQAPDFNYKRARDLYAPPFFQGPGLVGVKYLRSPVDPVTKQQVGLTMFSNTTNGAPFPDPVGDKQLFRYLKGDTQCMHRVTRFVLFLSHPAAPVRACSTAGGHAFLRSERSVQPEAGRVGDDRGGQTHGAPVKVPQYTSATRWRRAFRRVRLVSAPTHC
jgi:hypothetical protein